MGNKQASRGFHHVAIRCGDFDASVRFYTQALGFVPTLQWGQGDGRAIMLDSGDGSCVELFAGGTIGHKPEGAILHLALRSGDCDADLARARAAGAAVTMEPTDIDVPTTPVKPIRIAFCKGPDGEIIEFFQEKMS